MQNEKKMYQAPKVYAHGSVNELTLKGGGDWTDVPAGTNDNGDVSTVTGTSP